MNEARSTLVEEGKIVLSRNILKQQEMPEHGKKISIKTANLVSQTNKQTDPDPQLTAFDQQLAHKTVVYQQKLKQLKAQMLVDAQEEAQRIKQEAYDAGHAQGKKDGYQQALTAGKKEMATLVDQAKANVEKSLKESSDYIADKKTEIISFVEKMTESILQTQLEIAPKKIISILSPLLFELEKADEVLLIWANSSYHDALSTKLKQIKSEIPDIRYIIFDDDSLDALQIRVESNEAVVDIDIKKELKDFLKQL